jgi:hypothetical protein
MSDILPVVAEFTDYFNKLSIKEYPAEGIPDKLRVSGFPYCGLRHAYMRMLQLPSSSSFLSNYYFGAGKWMHTTVQHALGCGGRIYGNWKCVNNGCKGSRLFSKNNKCPICSSVLVYDEIRLNLREYEQFSNLADCLIDGVYRTLDGEFFIVDYKSAGLDVIRDMVKAKLQNPIDVSNIAQVKAYCPLIEFKYNIEISGWILPYISRDNPKKLKVFAQRISTKEKKRIIKKIELYNKHYLQVMNLKSFKQVELLIEEKPCQTVEQYREEYRTFGGCKLSCICFERKRLLKELHRAWDLREEDFLTWKRPKGLELP